MNIVYPFVERNQFSGIQVYSTDLHLISATVDNWHWVLHVGDIFAGAAWLDIYLGVYDPPKICPSNFKVVFWGSTSLM